MYREEVLKQVRGKLHLTGAALESVLNNASKMLFAPVIERYDELSIKDSKLKVVIDGLKMKDEQLSKERDEILKRLKGEERI